MRNLLVLALAAAAAVAQTTWQQPPKALVDCITAAPPPAVSVSPTREWLVASEREGLPDLATIARPSLALAGLRIDPSTRGREGGERTLGFVLISTRDGSQRKVATPQGGDLGAPVWNARGDRFVCTHTTATGIELWLAEVATGKTRRIEGVRVAATLGAPVRWLSDQDRLLVQLVAHEGPPPAAAPAPAGPNVEQTRGRKAPVRTYQDLLRSEHDQALFEHYMTTQIALVDPDLGRVERLGAPGLYTQVDASPDAKHLLVTRLMRPYSYRLPASGFAKEITVWDLGGTVQKKVAELPSEEGVPIDGVLAGPRQVRWVPHRDAMLCWTEALDGGDPKQKAPLRDRVLVQEAPFTAEATLAASFEHRLQGVQFLEGHGAFATEVDRDKRWQRTWLVPRPGEPKQLLFERSTQDAYADPGAAVQRVSARGDAMVLVHEGAVYLEGQGATPRGDRPFLARLDLATRKSERLFTCADGVYERVTAVLEPDASRVLVVQESRTQPPSWFVLDRRTGQRQCLLEGRDQLAELTKGIHKQRLEYTRKDGVKLTATLYLPAQHKEGMKWPVFVWAYPREFNDPGTAGQVRGSEHRYTRLAGTSPLLLLLAGYAVLDDAAMPVVGPPETANDTFVPQIVDSAQAAIDAVVALGVAERDRFAVGGHSYGAFMTANLLAHCDLFRCGIARSGAYNRSLTPFGFQNERRTYWEAVEVYTRLSPFSHAQRIHEPLLLIHGEADNNPGTFPIQSQRLFQALMGNGGTARLVMLPHESHGYRARESVLHCMAEMVGWLDRYLKSSG